MRARMTLCNMSAELGAQAGVIAPDDMTAEWLASRAPDRVRLDDQPDSYWASDAGRYSN